MSLEMSFVAARAYPLVGKLWFCLEFFNGFVTFTSYGFQIFATEISFASEKIPSSRIFLKQIINLLRKYVENMTRKTVTGKALLSP